MRRIQQEAAPADIAARWEEVGRILPLYAALASEFDLGAAPSGEREVANGGSPEAVERIERWLDEMDQRVGVQQLRQYLQSCEKLTEEGLRALALRHLQRPNKTAADRDKIDFLLVQYFALCAPERIFSQDVGLADVAEVLRPVVGEADPCLLDWLQPLEGILEALRQCHSLRDLLEREILEQGRRVKESAGDMAYDPSALVAFSRFNFLLRRSLIRLMQADLRAIRSALGELESRGIRALDGRCAAFSAAEPTSSLWQFCQAWKQPFRMNNTEYALGPTFERLLAIRAAVEKARAQLQPVPSTRETRVASSFGPAAAGRKSVPTGHVSAPQSPAEAGKAASAAAAGSASVAGNEPTLAVPTVAELEDFSEAIWEQLIEAPLGRGRSVAAVVLEGTRVFLYAWEVAAFVSDGGPLSHLIQRAVVTRALVAVAIESCKRSGDSARLRAILPWARQQVAELQEPVDQSQGGRSTEAAVNLGISAKRLVAFIEQAENENLEA